MLALSNGGEQDLSSRVEGGGVPVVDGGDVSVWRPVSREFMECELARWKCLLDRLGGVEVENVDVEVEGVDGGE